MTVQPCRKRRDHWSEEDDGVRLAYNYKKRFGMTRHRFETLMRHFDLNVTESVCEEDNWKKVRPFLEAMNANFKQTISVSGEMCIDECMSAWKGKDSIYYGEDGMPHVIRIFRKPEGIGLELKAIACGLSGLIYCLEIQEDKASLATKKYNEEYGAGTGITLRLMEGTTLRTNNGDSAFSSVKTATQVKKTRNEYRGCVKTATKLFPKKYIEKQLKDKPRGSKSEVDSCGMER
eukprot:Awhi_evm1s10392